MLVTFGASGLRLSPPGKGRLETAPTYEVTVTGAASNAAIAAARLGTEAVWLSKLPGSPLGRRVAGAIRDHGVDVEAVRGPGRVGVRYVERGARPRPDASIEDRSRTAVADVSAEEFPLDRVRDARMLYVTGAPMDLSTEVVRTTAALLRTANEAGVRTAFGLRHRGDWSLADARETFEGLFSAIDVLLTGEPVLREVFARGEDTPPEMAHAMGAAHGFAQVVLLRDRGGLVWADNTVNEVTAPEVDEVDPGGAADAFAGAYLAGILDGSGVDAALDNAVAAATLARTTPGDLPTVTPEEVAALRERMTAG